MIFFSQNLSHHDVCELPIQNDFNSWGGKKSNKPKDDENTVPVLKDLYYVIKVRISLTHISFSRGSDFGHNLLQTSDRLYLI